MPFELNERAGRRREELAPLHIRLPLGTAVVAAAAAITAGVTAAGAPATTDASGGGAALQALGRGVTVAIPLVVALYACTRPAHSRFGRVFLAVSGVWFFASLSTSSSPLVYSVARVSGWVFAIGLGYALLAYPGGLLRSTFDRLVIAFSVCLVVTLYVPSVLFGRFPSPSPTSTCSAGCPHNALMVAASQPGIIGSVITPVRDMLTVLILLTVAARLWTRINAANPLTRRTLVPVLGAMIAWLIVFAVLVPVRSSSPDSALAEALAWTELFAVPAIALAFLTGLVRWHVFISSGARTINARLRELPGPEHIQHLLADAFADPMLEIGAWSAEERHWIGVDGQPLDEPGADSDRWLSAVEAPRGQVAIVYDRALGEDPAFLEAAATAASVAFESDRVAARTRGVVRELRASRARILAAADDERRRIERDLHDGAQQRLVGLLIHLELAADKAQHKDPEEAIELRQLAVEVEQALEEMRSLTREIYPPMLADRGLPAAVRAAALRSPVPATVEVEGLGSYPQEIATAVYFCCVEALQNVAKHALDASEVEIVLRETGSVLRFSVCDDGPGMIERTARVGAGMLNMNDRIATVGGELTVRSRPGHGTCVIGRIPLSALARSTPPVWAPDHGSRLGSPRRRGQRETN